MSEHARLEQDTAQGGYGHRQLFELVQNSADALLNSVGGRTILVRLTKENLYCADDGSPIDEEGIKGLMFDRMSSKRNTAAIGRFGRGFKSVLRVTDSPEFFSRSGSLRFDKIRSKELLGDLASDGGWPVLRLPEPVEPESEYRKDEDLRELMSWANNVVRLPLSPGAYADISKQLDEFPPEFLLFVDHVCHLTLEDLSWSRTFELRQQGDELLLDTGQETARWRRFACTHRLSEDANSDWHLGKHSGEAVLNWAVPIDRLDRPGHFWAFFPTDNASLVAGILNAPWKTNEDRQNLLSGPYNLELVDVAAQLVADSLACLPDPEDPARHLDALPRRHESGDSELVDRLRERLFALLKRQEFVPDQRGHLRTVEEISYPPRKLVGREGRDALQCWCDFYGRPIDWLHQKATSQTRFSRIDAVQGVQEQPISRWLEALATGKTEEDAAVEASVAALRAAAAMPGGRSLLNEDFGRIVLCADMTWELLNVDRLLLSDGNWPEEVEAFKERAVHPRVASDPEALRALKKFGIKPPSAEGRFEIAARRLAINSGSSPSNEAYTEFWLAARGVPKESVLKTCRTDASFYSRLRVRAVAGDWKPLYSVLIPGEIVASNGYGEEAVAVDMSFHASDEELLRNLGVADVPLENQDLSTEPCFKKFQEDCRKRFINRDLEKNPHRDRLVFKSSMGAGPLSVLSTLPDDKKAKYTSALLLLDATFSGWSMHHKTQSHIYPDLNCESISIWHLQNEGKVRTRSGAVLPISDAVGQQPKSQEVLHTLLCHPNADKIRKAFDLAGPVPAIIGEGDAVPLIDIWPSLQQFLRPHQKQHQVVPCQSITVMGAPRDYVVKASDVFVTGAVEDDTGGKLRLVLEALEIEVNERDFESILRSKISQEIEEFRTEIRQNSISDAERLLNAVGEGALRRGLPSSLLAVLEKRRGALNGIEVAEAAIATFHTDALKQYRSALDWLSPPAQWAGSARAVAFVQSLGFSPIWAGERGSRLVSFLEVEGRFILPELHDYQKAVVRNLREMIHQTSAGARSRRGLISLPTGSGKTRVAVQGITEAIREKEFTGGVLWVADRSELCEQAVQAWQQVWSSIGPHNSRLRISRMWKNQPNPAPMKENHVVVASIQTLHARLRDQVRDNEFLHDFGMVVFDEAHRSVAPTFTSVMEEIGLTRRRSADEPLLLGLTATPYRGYDEDETRWLVNRYGRNRLDEGAFSSDDAEDVIRELQSMGVLAQADHALIEGETLSLDELMEGTSQSEDWQNLPWLPQSAEDRIAGSVERTERILNAYEEHIDPDWPTLIFATSVEHAKTMSALLNKQGVRARAVSGDTETLTRRRLVEEFRQGEIKALVNYGVFREGFDAPRTRAIIVARPVYSPNLYFQMIGRGLRGPKNGGGDRCLILNVTDNIKNFDRSLAFSELDWLWA
ncbi:MAG: DEAD/DEAH box helicase family protein [Rhodobacteraceae bacterium]|nr:DEAD/DEAH box helicase family protein [Paracoccaceae bacterium]